MTEREQQRLVSLALDIGERMLLSGGEVSRALLRQDVDEAVGGIVVQLGHIHIGDVHRIAGLAHDAAKTHVGVLHIRTHPDHVLQREKGL